MNFKSSILGYFVAGILITAPLLPVQSPEELQKWMSINLIYQQECEDCNYWKSPQETIKDKGGDCEDLALLASRSLFDLKIKNNLIYVVYLSESKLRAVGHIICLYKNFDGTYSFFSNTELINTKFQSLSQLLKYYFPNWTRAAYVNLKTHIYYDWLYPWSKEK